MQIESKLKVKVTRECNILEDYEVYSAGFNEGLSLVKRKDKEIRSLGFIDTKGNEVIPCEYYDAYDFHCGRAMVEKDNWEGFINKKGEIVVPCVYHEATKFDFNYSVAKISYISKDVNVVLDLNGRVLFASSNDLTKILPHGYVVEKTNPNWHNNYKIWNLNESDYVKKIPFDNQIEPDVDISGGFETFQYLGENYFCIGNYRGKFIVRISGITGLEATKVKDNIKKVFICSEGLIPALFSNGKMGYINWRGETIIPPKFDIVQDFKNGKAVVCYKKHYRVIDKNGVFCHKTKFKNSVTITENDLYITYDGKDYYYVDENNNNVFGKKFSVAHPFQNGIALVLSKDEDEWYFIDTNGNKVTKTVTSEYEISSIDELPEYSSIEILEYIYEVRNGEEVTYVRGETMEDCEKKLKDVINKINMDKLSEFVTSGYVKKME